MIAAFGLLGNVASITVLRFGGWYDYGDQNKGQGEDKDEDENDNDNDNGYSLIY